MKRAVVLAFGVLVACGCQRTPNEVMNKVLVDFGVREKPEGYVEPSDKVFARLRQVGQTEIKRMNQESRQGEIKFQEAEGLQGKYYKEVKVYENFHPLEANAVTRSGQAERGYVGYIEYSYRVYQGARKATRAEAAAEDAGISTDLAGRETYRYKFNAGGIWEGGKGESVTR
ncbi:MAG: hypothetical protein HY706_02335 [Candidatus Hydrogenedentes bacterium]|nr:hypothetical protein [Candidatus Hydrogenedentota bacterium]